ncbi:MAG: hypothetical protein ABSA49_19825, partial [Rhizomicrobium sp.]
DEHENWVWKGTDCTPSLARCLVNLSRGGGDAVVIREFDLASKTFVKDGFNLPEAKATATYWSENTVLFGTDFGPGSMTTSGYPNVVKLWARGEPTSAAKTVFTGKLSDVSSGAVVFRHSSDDNTAIIQRGVSFFESEYYLPAPDGPWTKLPLPLSADLKGMTNGQIVFTLRSDWAPPGGAKLTRGSLIAFALKDYRGGDNVPPITVLYAPGPRSTVDEVSTGRDAVYASIYDNVIGSIHAFRFDPAKNAWSDTMLDLPGHGSTHIVSTNDYGPEAQFRFENFVTPTTLYGDLERRHEDSLFRHAREELRGPCANCALRLWRLRGFGDTGLLDQFRIAVAF